MRVIEATDEQPEPVVKVARDLTAIEHLTAALLTQAVHKANDPLMPGGRAMVMLAGVASPETWERRVEVTEDAWWDSDDVPMEDRPDWLGNDEDDAWEPPLQTLLFWSEAWRGEHGYPLPVPTTIASEANFIRWALNWAWENEPHFADFARDIARARSRMEAELREGEPIERGVPCLYDACKGARLTRKLERDGRRWLWSDWRCKRCRRTWDEDAYARMVTAGSEAAKIEQVAGQTWSTIEYAAREVGRSVKTIRTWVNDGKVAIGCIVVGRRVRFVNLEDVRREDTRAGRRVRNRA